MSDVAPGSTAISLLPAKIDLLTQKTQFVFSAVIAVAAACAMFHPRTQDTPQLLAFLSQVLSTLLVAGIAGQLSSQAGGRLAPAAAAWSSLLFVLFAAGDLSASKSDAHVLQLLGTAGCLSAIYCYVRFRCLKETGYLTTSLLAYLCGLLTLLQAIAVGPIVLASELIIFKRSAAALSDPSRVPNQLTLTAARFMPAASYFMVAIMVGTGALAFPTSALPIAGLSASLHELPHHLLQPETWLDLVIPPSGSASSFTFITIAPLVVAGLLWFLRSFSSPASVSSILWLCTWLVLALVPAPAAGTASMLLPQAALAIALACCCLPCVDSLPRRLSVCYASLGSLTLVVIAGQSLLHTLSMRP